jgi:putative ABC transport system permease protein
MLKYHFKTAIRNIKSNPVFALINIFGLSLAFSLAIFILVWLQYEFSFDRFNNKADRIFRVTVEFQSGNSSDFFANTQAPLGDYLKKNIPEIVDYVRFGNYGHMLVSNGREQFRENIESTDPSIFRIFSFKFLSGDPDKALSEPMSILLTKTKAKKYFGNIDPIGKTLFIGKNMQPYTVTGILEDIPSNSQLQFDFLVSFKEDPSWQIWNYTTYILAQNKSSFSAIDKKLRDVVTGMPVEGKIQLHIQPLPKIHLHSRLRADFPNNIDIRVVYILSSILILVLVIASINYVNLSIARYIKKGKETGLRKVNGASNNELAGHFLAESFIISLAGALIAIVISFLTMPYFISLTGIMFENNPLLNFGLLLKFIILAFLAMVITGLYPAYTIASVNPASSIRNDLKIFNIDSTDKLRKGLVIFQFVISITLISCTLIVKFQESYIKNKEIGLSHENIIVIPFSETVIKPNYELFRKEILINPSIISVSATNYTPGALGYCQNVWWEGLPEDNNSNMMSWIPADQDFTKTLGIELLNGESFPDDISINSGPKYILNELAVKEIGWENPVGKQINIMGKGEVTGVVKNFYFESLHTDLQPVALVYYPGLFDRLMIKISPENARNTITFLRNKWVALFPKIPFEYSFLSDDFRKMYQKDAVTDRLVTITSLIALLISCFGLFGLVMLTIERRIKEIGIRKVSGSTSLEIVSMLNFDYIKSLSLAFIISCPFSYFLMQKWLENFAYRINPGWWMFALAWVIITIISLLTITWHTWKAANKNPVECLRNE